MRGTELVTLHGGVNFSGQLFVYTAVAEDMVQDARERESCCLASGKAAYVSISIPLLMG